MTAAATIATPAEAKVFLLGAVSAMRVKQMPVIERIDSARSHAALCASNWRRRSRWTIPPARIGTITTFRISTIIFAASISTKHPASTFIATGVRNGERRVEQQVMVTESATSAFARKAITFDAVPPATDPTSTHPAASSPEKPNDFARRKPTSGITRNWSTTPVATAHGRFATRRKSSTDSVVPIPNMMIWIAGTTSETSLTPPHSSKAEGKANATAALARTAMPNAWRRTKAVAARAM